LERQASKIATRVGAAHMIQPHPTTDFEYRAPQGVWVDYLADSLLPMFNAWRAEHGIEPEPPRSGPPISLEEAKASATKYWAREASRAEQAKEELAAPKRERHKRALLKSALREAEKAGRIVTSATVEGDKVVLTFDEPNSPASDNPWDLAAAELRKGRQQ
jgi:hypothetical protein